MENVFLANPKVSELLVFPDGTAFVNDAAGQNNALNYASQTKQEFKKVIRKEEPKEQTEEKTNKKK